jgi:hypothetical protein
MRGLNSNDESAKLPNTDSLNPMTSSENKTHEDQAKTSPHHHSDLEDEEQKQGSVSDKKA